MGREWTPMPLPGFLMVFGVRGDWSKSFQIPSLMEAAPTPIV